MKLSETRTVTIEVDTDGEDVPFENPDEVFADMAKMYNKYTDGVTVTTDRTALFLVWMDPTDEPSQIVSVNQNRDKAIKRGRDLADLAGATIEMPLHRSPRNPYEQVVRCWTDENEEIIYSVTEASYDD